MSLANSPWAKKYKDLHNTSLTSYVGFSSKPIIKWQLASDSQIVIDANNVIYTSTYDSVNSCYCINAINKEDGSIKWTYDFTGSYEEPYGTPSIDSTDVLYIGTDQNYLYAINISDGSLKWKYLAGDTIEGTSTIASDGTIYFNCDDKYLYAVNSDGTLKWKYYLDLNNVNEPPAIADDGTIYDTSPDGIIAINSDGTLKWSYNSGCGTLYTINSDGIIYYGVYNDGVYAINPDGTLKWKFTETFGGYTTTIYNRALDINNSLIYCAADNYENGYWSWYLYAIDISGAKQWEYNIDVSHSIMVIDDNGILYVGQDDASGGGGHIYALDKNGNILWTFAMSGQYNSVQALNSEKTLYVRSGGYLYALEGEKLARPFGFFNFF